MADRHNTAMIPLSQLQLSKLNVRRTSAEEAIGELAASIEAHGVLQNLIVRPAATGCRRNSYEVIAGGRRYRALKQLAKRKRLPKDHPVPCTVRSDDDEGKATEVSLAENVVRAPLHPADQFDAFQALYATGLGAEEIASRFGVSSTLVLQRLKLAAVSPRLVAEYRGGEMTLDQLTAFTVSDDHEAQEQVWFERLAPYERHPRTIRRLLTETLIPSSDRRARLVGLDAYEKAGGTVIRDLFDDKDAGYLEDGELLDRLVAERLADAAQDVSSEDWSWVEARAERDYDFLARHRHIPPAEAPLSDRDEKRVAELSAKHDALIERIEDDDASGIGDELDQLEAELAALADRRQHWSAEDKARSGALITLEHDGKLKTWRGLLRPEQRVAKATTPAARQGSTGESRKGVSEALRADLSAHRTAALQAAFIASSEVALTALLYTLVLRLVHNDTGAMCIDVQPVPVSLQPFSPTVMESKAVTVYLDHMEAWRRLLPEQEDLWTWLQSQSLSAKLELMAFCVATITNAVAIKGEPASSMERRRTQSDNFAAALALDMTEWWEPTAETYFGHVTKDQMIAAVGEAVPGETAKKLDGLKKAPMADKAEELLKGTGWLPEQLRPNAYEPRPQ